MSNIISQVNLNDNNSANWSRLTINALKYNNKLGFVDRSVIKPSISSPEFFAWERCNSMVIAWLYNIIDKYLHMSMAYVETAR